jgi:hypothetical protein
MTPSPPRWAEAVLRLVLRPVNFDCVSGDLLEEYRDSIHPVQGRAAADRWYVVQVLGFVVRNARVWAVLFATAFITRTALDWLAPPVDFYTRSAVSTFVGVGLLVGAGAWAALRSGSPFAGTLVGVSATATGAFLSIAGASALLVIWHDANTLAAVRASGGLAEVFELPIVMIFAGAVFGTIGGLAGATLNRLRST